MSMNMNMNINMKVNFSHPLALKIRKLMSQALNDFSMLKENDRLMVCVSGGKDSSVMLALLTELQRMAPFDFTFEAALLDQKQPGFHCEEFKNWVNALGVKLHVIEKDTYSIVKEKTPEGKTYCTLCSKFRRAILYDFAFDNGFTKMALGHHRDDVNTTTLLNLFYIGQLSSMPAKLISDDQRNTVIRPMCYVAESEINQLAQDWKIPIIPCNLCGSQDQLKRKRIKQLIMELQKEIPHIASSMQTALTHVKPRHLMDKSLWDFDKS